MSEEAPTPRPSPVPTGEGSNSDGREIGLSPNPTPLSRAAGEGRGVPKAQAIYAIVAYVAFNLLLPLIPIPLHHLRAWQGLALTLVPTTLFMLLQVWLSRALVGLRPTPLIAAIGMVLSVGAWYAVIFLLFPHKHWAHWINLPLLMTRPLLIGLCITLACTFFGVLLSRIVREANVLMPVALIAMPIDYLGAMTPIGFTQNAVKQHPSIVQAVSVPVPAMGGLHPIAFIGPGDALFMAFFFAIVLRLGLNDRGTFWAMFVLLALTMGIVLVTGLPIAALVPMGLAVLFANRRYFHLKREEVFAVIYAGGLVLALVVAFYFYSHSHFFHSRGH